jgi:hypothetical protein
VTPRGRIQSVGEVEACAEYGFVDDPHAVPELYHFATVLRIHYYLSRKYRIPIRSKGQLLSHSFADLGHPSGNVAGVPTTGIGFAGSFLRPLEEVCGQCLRAVLRNDLGFVWDVI